MIENKFVKMIVKQGLSQNQEVNNELYSSSLEGHTLQILNFNGTVNEPKLLKNLQVPSLLN